MADDREDLFGDLEDFDAFGGLDETPSGLNFPEDEDPFHMEPPREEGISRAFKFFGALIGLAVMALVILLVWFAMRTGDELTDNEKQSTEIAGTNVALEGQYNATLTALALIEQATQTQVHIDEMTGTAIVFEQQTQEAVRATSQAETATAEAVAQQTLAAEQTATQEASNVGATATADANRVRVRILDPAGNVIDTVTIRLYKDDGDEVFTPADRLNPAGGESGTGGESGGGGDTGTLTGEAQPIDFGEIAEGTLERGQVAEWTFTGTQGDSVIINAIAGDPVQMDMFMELYGPDGSLLLGDDDSGDASNAAITGFTLPQDGRYSIRVSSVASPGAYTLLLSRGLSIPSAPAEEPAVEEAEPAVTPEAPAEPTQEGATGWVAPSGDDGIVLAGYQPNGAPAAYYRQGTPTPIPDDLIEIIEEATEGIFDFGALEPGTYWVELDYDSLPPELQALVAPGQPLVFKLIVPVGGEFTIELGVEPTPTVEATPTGEISDFDLTATAFGQRTGSPVPTIDTDIVTLTPSPEITGTLPAPQGTIVGTGIFSDIGEDGDLGGTSGLTVLAIAAAGLVAVVFIARKLRTSA